MADVRCSLCGKRMSEDATTTPKTKPYHAACWLAQLRRDWRAARTDQTRQAIEGIARHVKAFIDQVESEET